MLELCKLGMYPTKFTRSADRSLVVQCFVDWVNMLELCELGVYPTKFTKGADISFARDLYHHNYLNNS